MEFSITKKPWLSPSITTKSKFLLHLLFRKKPQISFPLLDILGAKRRFTSNTPNIQINTSIHPANTTIEVANIPINLEERGKTPQIERRLENIRKQPESERNHHSNSRLREVLLLLKINQFFFSKIKSECFLVESSINCDSKQPFIRT